MPNKNVKLPDGRVVAFPDTMSDDEISGAIRKNIPATPGTGLNAPGIRDLDTVKMYQQFKQNHPEMMANPMVNAGIGAVKGALSTGGNLLNMIPGINRDNRAAMQQATTAQGTAQQLGKTVEQGAEFLIPGGAEESALAHIAPFAGRAMPLAKAGVAALGSGAVNTAQGG